MQVQCFKWRWSGGLLLAAMALLGAVTPATAMNKCTSTEGKVTYQDEACGGGNKAENANIQHYKQPPPPGTAAPVVAAAATPATAPVPTTQPKAKAKGLPENAEIHTGPRGGRYVVLPTGKKRYLPKER